MISFEPLPTTLVRAEPMDRRQFLTQRKAPAVRVKLAVLQREFRRRDRLGRRSPWVFVRGQLDNRRRIKPQLTRHIFNGFARLIDRLRKH